MKKEYNRIKNIVLIVCLLFVILFSFQFLVDRSVESNDGDIYDVILFWGQSNMIGYCGRKENERVKDTRYSSVDFNCIKQHSERTGIDIKILTESMQMNWVKIKQVKNSAYEYMQNTNSLNAITSETKRIGETLKFDTSKKMLETPTDMTFSIQKSYGTNMVQQFCKTYYEKTKHKVIVVFAANGGEKIANFLPSSDNDYGDLKRQMIYESMVEKYKSAINCVNNSGLKIGNRIWIAFHGESDVKRGTSTHEYKRLFLKVKNNLKRDLKIDKGVITETSYTIGTGTYEKVNNIHIAQKQLADENNDIIIGSSYAYDRYVPDRKTYESGNYHNRIFTDSMGRKLPYVEAFKIASYSVCYPNNTIHLTSAALSQIGKETAESLARVVMEKIKHN